MLRKCIDSSGATPLTTGRCTAFALLLLAMLICTGCGDVFRPVANPQPGPVPDPKNFHFAIVASQNAPGNQGSAMQIDVSGDTNVGVVKAGALGLGSLGQGPVHAAILTPNANRVYVANGLNDSVTTFSPANLFGPVSTAITITLPTGSQPVFVHSTESGRMYVANFAANNVAVINTISNVVTNFIAVGANPAVLAETPDGRKLYSVNKGAGSITAINTVDLTSTTISGFTGLVWAVASLDSKKLYVLDQNGLSVIEALTDTPIPPVVPLAAGSNFMALDPHLNRLYITNPGAGSLTILDAAVTPPMVLPNTVALPSTVAMATPLNDGTRAYVASYQVGACTAPNDPADTCVSSQVQVIRTSDNTLSKTIDLGSVDLTSTGLLQSKPVCDDAASSGRFPVSMASSVDSSRVYVANCYAGSTSVIRTSDDTCMLDLTNTRCANITAPLSAYPGPSGQPAPPPPPQNPMWVVAAP
jgi:DNA-binding beta-propeller fold protein YncE